MKAQLIFGREHRDLRAIEYHWATAGVTALACSEHIYKRLAL